MKCLRIYADETGDSHLADIDIPLVPTEVFPGVPAIYLSAQHTATSVRFAWVPPGIREAWRARDCPGLGRCAERCDRAEVVVLLGVMNPACLGDLGRDSGAGRVWITCGKSTGPGCGA